MKYRITDIQQDQIKKVVALMAEGKGLNIALKDVKMSYNTFRDVLGCTPNPTYDFIQKILQRYVKKYMEYYIYDNTELNEEWEQTIKKFFDSEVTAGEMGLEELLDFKASFYGILYGLVMDLNSVIQEYEAENADRQEFNDEYDLIERRIREGRQNSEDDIPF